MSKPKFELICKGDGGTSQVFTLKNVSSVIVSNIQIESFDLVFHDGEIQNLMTNGTVLPTSLGSNEMKEFICSHAALRHRSVGYNTIQLVFTVEDEQSNQYKCVATKNVEDARKYILGPWEIKVEYLQSIHGDEETDEDKQSGQNYNVSLPHEFISACAKIADNPASYARFDEDSLNREVRNFLDSAITRFGYSIADQTQQGLSGSRPGELDIRISKKGIPVAIYEGLIHKDRKWLESHINKAIGKYNQSGCKAVYVVEFSRNRGFGGFWDEATEVLDEYSGIEVKEENTCLLGVKMLKGIFEWEKQKGDFYYIGVNCYVKPQLPSQPLETNP